MAGGGSARHGAAVIRLRAKVAGLGQRLITAWFSVSPQNISDHHRVAAPRRRRASKARVTEDALRQRQHLGIRRPFADDGL